LQISKKINCKKSLRYNNNTTRLTALIRDTRVSRYQEGKTNFTEATDSEWLWHQLGYMQACTSLQTDSHASTPPLIFYGPDALLPPSQQRQITLSAANNHYAM